MPNRSLPPSSGGLAVDTFLSANDLLDSTAEGGFDVCVDRAAVEIVVEVNFAFTVSGVAVVAKPEVDDVTVNVGGLGAAGDTHALPRDHDPA